MQESINVKRLCPRCMRFRPSNRCQFVKDSDGAPVPVGCWDCQTQTRDVALGASTS